MTEATKADKAATKADKAAVETYTYVGAGADIPEVCDFMGLQRFIRFEETEVSNPVVLAKLKNHPCFVKGAAEKAVVRERDEIERGRVAKQKREDAELNDAANKRNKKYA